MTDKHLNENSSFNASGNPCCFTGVAILSHCLRIQFLFQRHNFNVQDLLLQTLEQ